MEAIFYKTAADAFVSHQTDAPVVAVKYRVHGFYPIYTKSTPDALNASQAWTQDEIESAFAASMFGWDAPIARAAHEAVKSREAQS